MATRYHAVLMFHHFWLLAFNADVLFHHIGILIVSLLIIICFVLIGSPYTLLIRCFPRISFRQSQVLSVVFRVLLVFDGSNPYEFSIDAPLSFGTFNL